MSVICRTFVQNAWRSDLCSNCFKSLEDHADGRRSGGSVLAVPRYVPQAPSLYQSRGISTSLKWRLNESLYDRVSRRDIASQTHVHSKPVVEETPPQHPGILVKNGDSSEKKLKSRSTVDFAQEEALVIGYGGNDYDSDTSPWEMGSDDGSIDLDLLDDTDEDRKITRLTRNNTEFNSFNKNLLLAVRKDEKLNSINNSVNNQVKSTDKTINILTYNDIQSTKPEKKLNQYFFPSSTEIKSFLNSSSVSLEDVSLKNNNEKISANAKIQNCNREPDKKENTGSKISLNDNFTPLNTRTYSFVSEMNKHNSTFEQSSDSDYSTCRFTAGDSTDSESFQDAEDARHSPKSSFLHSKYVISSPQLNELDMDKKYDAGSSTSGDISNFSDDSDTHEITDRAPYKSRNQKPSLSSEISKKVEERTQINSKQELSPQFNDKEKEHDNRLLEKIEEERSFQKKSPKESPKTEIKQIIHEKNDQKEKQSPPTSTKLNSESEIYCKEINNKTQSTVVNTILKDCNSEFKQQMSNSDAMVTTTKEKSVAKSFSKSPSLPDITPDTFETNPSPISKSKESPKNNRPVNEEHISTLNTSGDVLCTVISSKNVQKEILSKAESKEIQLGKISENNLTENICPKEHVLNDKEFRECEDNSDSEKSPDAIANRQSKLAALALELELARRDMEAKNAKSTVSPPVPLSPPEVKVRYSQSSAQNNPNSDNYPTIKKVSAISCASRLPTLPDVLQETPTKQKKSKFSLKKLLKRNKDSGTFSPASNKEVNPKAWKKQTFDRNRLSLEILHPMDLTSDVPTSADSTPTEEHKPIVSTNPGKFMFKGVSSRARSLSALPQLSSDDHSGIALLDCRKMDTVPMRKAGTVAERKKSRPSLVRTPSCSALPNRSVPSSAVTSPQRSPPPKPPPPPKCSKAMHPPPPPPPHSHPRAAASKSVTGSPARPPPPKVPETKSRSHSSGSSAQELHEQNHSDKEYANLGDIRSLITPKKPQRPSAFSAPPRDGGMEAATHNNTIRRGGGEDSATIYETLPADEEEDHYTYLDETAETKALKEANRKNIESIPKTKTSGESVVCARPWLDLQTSYAAIAAANYESLAELMTTTLNEGAEFFKSMENALKWRDFALDSEQQFSLVKDKAVYNAVYKNKTPGKVTLVVAPRKLSTPQNTRNQTRYPVFACFSDHVPKNFVNSDNYILQDSEMASVYILQRSKVTTVLNFAKASSMDPTNQYIHLRNYCFVLLQMIHTLKSLQAEGIEEINYDLQILALVETDEDKPPILVLFPEDKVNLTQCDLSNKKTLCQATLETMLHFLQIFSVEDLKSCLVNGEYLTEPVAHTFKAIAKVLSEEKASSLSQAKGFLEYMLWGPVDVKVSQNDSEDMLDTILQRWLDLQRAQMVKSTISNLQNKKNLNIGPHVYEEYQLIFLLQASVKSLKNVISKL